MIIHVPDLIDGDSVQLRLLTKDHFPELLHLAEDKRIWEFYVFDGTDKSRFADILQLALDEKSKGTQVPFVIFHKPDNKIIGSTRFIDINPTHKKLEIGFTWLHPNYWATVVNLECKLLLLTYCFETAGTYRVQFKTDENNLRSRKAILKIGAQFEGILRNDMVRQNGTKRNSAYYSIIDTEWPNVKKNLNELILTKVKV